MSDNKPHQFRPPQYADSDGNGRGEPQKSDSESGREQQGWDAYRKWLSSMNGKPHTRRAPIDHSVYSWKGYHSWADRVRQSWKPEEN
jgi:hypothetical protein